MVTTTQSPARIIKSELVKYFKDVKFSVTTEKPFIVITWTIPLGSNALEQDVESFVKNNEIIQDYVQQLDTAYRLKTNCYYSDERLFWTVKYVESLYPPNTIRFSHRFNTFFYAHLEDDVWHPEAEIKKYFYSSHGIVCNLLDKQGKEPREKIEYYLDMAEKMLTEKKVLHPHEYHNICDDLCSMVKQELWTQAVNLLESRSAIEMLHIIGLIHDYSFLTQDEINQLCRHVGSNRLKLM